MESKVRCVIMRGGTSKAVFFAARDLPAEPRARDDVIMAAFGSPDSRQIDGLGGADPLTSKLAIIAPAADGDADVDYTFGQVGIATPAINYRVNCGNTAAAVGLYAVQEGLAQLREGTSKVTIHCTNSGKRIVAEVPTAGGEAVTSGHFRISGVPRAGAEIRLKFIEPAGGVTGRLLPTGRAVDEITLQDGRRVRLSLVDCGNLYAFIAADTWSLDGSELPEQIEAIPGLMAQVEQLREAVCRELVPDGGDARGGGSDRPRGAGAAAKLKIALVGPARSCRTTLGDWLDRDHMDLVARIVNQERVHKAFAVTGAIAVAAAAAVPSTVVHALCERGRAGARPAMAPSAELCPPVTLRIGHPQGIIEPALEADLVLDGGREKIVVRSVQVSRTARRIMEGFVYVPPEALARAPRVALAS